MDAPGWLSQLDEIIRAYAARHGLEDALREGEVLDD
jgi:hypothetical protein